MKNFQVTVNNTLGTIIAYLKGGEDATSFVSDGTFTASAVSRYSRYIVKVNDIEVKYLAVLSSILEKEHPEETEVFKLEQERKAIAARLAKVAAIQKERVVAILTDEIDGVIKKLETLASGHYVDSVTFIKMVQNRLKVSPSFNLSGVALKGGGYAEKANASVKRRNKFNSPDGMYRWSGVGLVPKWVTAYAAAGGKVSDLLTDTSEASVRKCDLWWANSGLSGNVSSRIKDNTQLMYGVR